MKEQTQRFGVSMDDILLGKLDTFIKRKGYANRSEAIRDFVRENPVEEEGETGKPVMTTTGKGLS